MATGMVLIIDRATGTPTPLREDEPVKLRVCRGCGRVHRSPAFCAQAA